MEGPPPSDLPSVPRPLGPPLSSGPRLSELITDRLLGLMRSGELNEGAKLPPERDLADMLGVSRTMIREALSALQLAGMVERRPGVGTVITRTPGFGFELNDHIQASASIAELIEARMAVEFGIAHLLCDQRDYDFTEVTAKLDAMKLAVRSEHKPEDYILPSLEFHLALGRATERPLISTIQENLIDLMRPNLWILAEKYDLGLAERSLSLHERMLTTIQNRDLIGALAEIRSHYTPYPILTLTSASFPPDKESVIVR